MMHKPIQIHNLSLFFPHKTCFEGFNAQIHYGNHIGIIGRNGSGKSTLLKILQGYFSPSSGSINIPQDAVVGYVPQIIEEFHGKSGGQRLSQALTQALSCNPNVLLLDEPTNHLDVHNRKSLLRFLHHFSGTLMIVSHDTEILRHCFNILWHVDNGAITIFSGNYDDYQRELQRKRISLENELSHLERQKKDMHQALMQEQHRAAKSRSKGERSIAQRKWPTIVSKAKAGRSQTASGHKKAAIGQKKQDLTDQLTTLRLPEILIPKFNLSAGISSANLVSIRSGAIGYSGEQPLLQNIHLLLNAGEHLAITGDNGSGKSTLVKAIMNDTNIIKTGDWQIPKKEDIGYLDQHYATLSPDKTVLESVAELVPSWPALEIRRHLTDFLFRKNEEVYAQVKSLSGGEKALLSLAQIAAKTPKLLILDEITNNLDLQTREYITNILIHYPGTMIVISHDADFLKDIGITDYYLLESFRSKR